MRKATTTGLVLPATVKVNVLLTTNHPSMSDLCVEIDDVTAPIHTPCAAFASVKAAGAWLNSNGYRYVAGTNGVWSVA